MRAHTNDYKNNIKLLGRQIDSYIQYDDVTIEGEDIYSITPHYEGSILKSVMKQLDIECRQDIPLGTEINCSFGVLVNDSYEYINFNSYIVYSSEKQEDTNTYKIVCYDKMLNAMTPYENMNLTYPMSIRNYLGAICNKLGLTFNGTSQTFTNYDKMIPYELYLQESEGNFVDMGYTFRDVLDEIAQATASTICINENNGGLDVRYINNTGDVIDEEFLKDINVNFGEKYGPINSIVLSRSAGADNVYLRDEISVSTNGLCELKISDNQIMNGNDRSDYLSGLLARLDGLEYYINDFVSTGVTYYDLCDRYSVNIGENTYSCIMFNDEIEITQGLVENIHTERPGESETDYTKADKTDRRLNQTYLIVDKQNQEISAVITQTTDPSNPNSIVNKVTNLTIRVGELESAISDVADLTVSGETSYASFDLSNVNTSEPIMIKIHPIGDNISYLYPRTNLYPSSNLYMSTRKIRFHNNTTNEDIDYILPDDLLYYNSTTYDEFYLDFDTQTCQVTKRCKYNADGSVGTITETIVPYPYPTINLTSGNYTISLLGYSSGYLFARLMAQNIYTTQFYTKVETNSLISQTSSNINLSVDQKLTNYSTTEQMNSAIDIKAGEINSVVATKVGNNEVISRINQTPESITINANKVNIDGIITAYNEGGTTTIDGDKITSGTITSSQVSSDVITTNNFSSQNISANQITTGTMSANRISGGTIDADNITVQNLNATNLNKGNLTNAGIKVYNGTGFIKLLKSSSLHPWMSAINLAWDEANGLNFCAASNVDSSVPTPFARIRTNSAKALYITNNTSNININASGSGAAITAGTYVRVQSIYVTSNQIRFNTNSSSTARIQSGGYGISLIPHNEYVYVGTSSVNNRILTNGGDPSSKNVKKNFKEIELNKVYDDFKKVNVYDYDYKYSNLGNDSYGFIIDEIENTETLSKYFYNYTVVKKVEDGKLLQINDGDEKAEETIEVKEWDKNSYIKGMFIVMKSMQEQIEKQQKQIEDLQNEINKLKEEK